MENNQDRILWIDIIKVFSIFCVLLLHISAPIVEKFNTIEMFNWHIGNIINSSVRMAVPLFFMISGVLLLNAKKESLSIFFKKRFFKVVIPLFAWTLIYLLFRKYVHHQDLNIIIEILKSVFSPRYFHLWFLYTIIGIYLVLPLLRILIYHSDTKLQIYFLILWFYAFSFIPFISEFTGQNFPNYLPMMSGFLGFLVLGYVLNTIKISKKLFHLSLVGVITSTLITIVGTYVASKEAHQFIPLFYHYSSFSTILQAIGYFIMIKYISKHYISTMEKLKSLIYTLSFASLGIYLIHPIILYIVKGYGVYGLNGENPLYSISLTVIVTYLLSFIVVFIMQKIPILKQIVPK